VELGNDLNWNHHIDQTTTKANGILAFLRGNLNKCSKEVKEKAYTTLVRPNFEINVIIVNRDDVLSRSFESHDMAFFGIESH
jgi:hypothetical protein